MKKLFALMLALSMLLCVSAANADVFEALQNLTKATPVPTEAPVVTAEPAPVVTEAPAPAVTEVPAIAPATTAAITQNTDAVPGTVALIATNVTIGDSERYLSGYYNGVVYNDTDSVVTLDNCQLIIKDEAGNELKNSKYISVVPSTLKPGEYGLVNQSFSFTVGKDVETATAPLTFEFTLNVKDKVSTPSPKLTVTDNHVTSEIRYSSTYYYMGADIINTLGEDVAGLKVAYILLDENNNLIFCNYTYLDDMWIIRAGDSITLNRQFYSEVSHYALVNGITPSTVLITVMPYGSY